MLRISLYFLGLLIRTTFYISNNTIQILPNMKHWLSSRAKWSLSNLTWTNERQKNYFTHRPGHEVPLAALPPAFSFFLLAEKYEPERCNFNPFICWQCNRKLIPLFGNKVLMGRLWEITMSLESFVESNQSSYNKYHAYFVVSKHQLAV